MHRFRDLARVTHELRRKFPDSYLVYIVRDLDGAFDHMPVRVDDWVLLKVSYGGQHYLHTAGPMGQRAIPAFQCMITTAFAAAVQ